jgi:hypothetical protein
LIIAYSLPKQKANFRLFHLTKAAPLYDLQQKEKPLYPGHANFKSEKLVATF